jgi:hypothetical protein
MVQGYGNRKFHSNIELRAWLKLEKLGGTVMRRLLTGYVIGFNRHHHRSGHVFQNRNTRCGTEKHNMGLDNQRNGKLR